MKLFRSIFSRGIFRNRKGKAPGAEGAGEKIPLTGSIGYDVDRLAMNVFAAFRSVLLEEPPTFIIPAIWGTEGKEELTKVQAEIYAMIDPVIARILLSPPLHMDNRDESRESTTRYLVRYMLLNKLLYMTELFRNLSAKEAGIGTGTTQNLDTLIPMGSA